MIRDVGRAKAYHCQAEFDNKADKKGKERDITEGYAHG